MRNTFASSDYHLLVNALQNKESVAFSALYDKYAATFYGEIKRNLFKKTESDQTLVDAFHVIWKTIPHYDPSKEGLFLWSMKKVRKEISKQKVNILLHEIFACQKLFVDQLK